MNKRIDKKIKNCAFCSTNFHQKESHYRAWQGKMWYHWCKNCVMYLAIEENEPIYFNQPTRAISRRENKNLAVMIKLKLNNLYKTK